MEKGQEEKRISVYLDDKKKSKPEEMTSEIARNASKEYKEDPAIMDKTKEWIRYNFADQFDQLNEEHEKEIKKLKEESEEMAKRLKEESAKKEKQTVKNLLSLGTLTIGEIARISGIDEKRIKELVETK